MGEETHGRNHVGGIPHERNPAGTEKFNRYGIPVREESCVGGILWERNPLCVGGILHGRNSVGEESRGGGIPWEESCGRDPAGTQTSSLTPFHPCISQLKLCIAFFKVTLSFTQDITD